MPDAPLRLPEDQTNIVMPEHCQQQAISTAMWVTCSTHERVWTQDQQENMARFCLWAAQRLGVIERIAKGEPWER